VSEWPTNRRDLKGGWSCEGWEYDYCVLAPNGCVFAPDSPLSVAQVADLRGVSPQAVLQGIKRGSIPARKQGRDWFISAAAAVNADPVKPVVCPRCKRPL
jgi:helix-turn-helix protein